VIPGAAGAVALLAALLLPVLLLGLVVALDRYEERLFSTSSTRGRHAARNPLPGGRRAASPARRPRTGPATAGRAAAATVRPKPPAVTP
jgi:hypothetical protein